MLKIESWCQRIAAGARNQAVCLQGNGDDKAAAAAARLAGPKPDRPPVFGAHVVNHQNSRSCSCCSLATASPECLHRPPDRTPFFSPISDSSTCSTVLHSTYQSRLQRDATCSLRLTSVPRHPTIYLYTVQCQRSCSPKPAAAPRALSFLDVVLSTFLLSPGPPSCACFARHSHAGFPDNFTPCSAPSPATRLLARPSSSPRKNIHVGCKLNAPPSLQSKGKAAEIPLPLLLKIRGLRPLPPKPSAIRVLSFLRSQPCRRLAASLERR